MCRKPLCKRLRQEKKLRNMNNQDFTEISKRYKETSLVQSSAADILLALLNIKKGESILDVGCGTGDLTKKLYDISKGVVIGIDQSQGMIEEARKNYGNVINFEIGYAENYLFNRNFDVIFCNSTFQWISNVEAAIINFYNSLCINGKIGIQAPAKKEYCPNFIKAINSIIKNENIGKIFKYFKNPWIFYDSAQEYADLFIKCGFEVPFSEIQTIETYYTAEEVYKIFASGAIAGYLNKDYYECYLTEEYINDFNKKIKEEFIKQAKHNGKVKLIFNRIFLIGIKK